MLLRKQFSWNYRQISCVYVAGEEALEAEDGAGATTPQAPNAPKGLVFSLNFLKLSLSKIKLSQVRLKLPLD